MQRIILHIDMDYFFAQIEERGNPQFRGKPLVVGADPAPEQVRCGAGPKKGEIIMKATGRGVVATCNYEARKYGIHSALPISRAYELCPQAIFLPVDMELYHKVSENIMKIVKKYSPPPNFAGGWEIPSLDEAYLDLSFLIPKRESKSFKNLKIGYKKAEDLARKLKNEILRKEKLTSTVGIGPNKLIAKMAAEKAKPDGLLAVKPPQVKNLLEPLDIEDLPGIGPKTAEKLRALKINKIKELKRLSKTRLKNMFGVVGESIFEKARGVDEAPISNEKVIKSIGQEHTFEKDTRDPEILFGTLEKIIKNVYKELQEAKVSFKTITVVCRFSGFETHTKSKTLEKADSDFEVLNSEAKKLFLKFLVKNLNPIRLIGLRVKF